MPEWEIPTELQAGPASVVHFWQAQIHQPTLTIKMVHL